MMRAASIVAVAAGALACSATPNILPTNDFNRPMDVAFMCLGGFGPEGEALQVSGRPMRHCHKTTGGGEVEVDPKASQTTRTFAFMPNGASGDLSVIDADKWKIVDLSQNSSGYGRVPLGALPEQISVSDDGCRLVSANRGSCDMTVVDPSALLAPVFKEYGSVPAIDPRGIQRRRAIRGDGTPLPVAPYEVMFLPTDTAALTEANNLCPAPGSQPATPWRALVTFPTCDLVALIELPSGNIIDSVQVKGTGDLVTAVRTGASPICPVSDCGLPPSDGGMPPGDDGGADGAGTDGGDDGGGDDGGGADAGVMNLAVTNLAALPPLGPRPTSIAIMPTGDHAYVSLGNASAILSLDLTTSSITPSAAKQTIKLKESGGSNRIRLSLDPYALRPDPLGRNFYGKFIGTGMAFLYVIARDGSVRIVDVFVPGSERECEANIDPLGTMPTPDPMSPPPPVPLPASASIVNGCLEEGTVPRRLFAERGLRFPSIPVDIAFADVRPKIAGKPTNTIEETVSGGYAWVLTSSGLVYLINLDPVPRTIAAVVRDDQQVLYRPVPDSAAPYVYKSEVTEAPVYPGTPRNRNFVSYSSSLDSVSGPPRIDLPPIWSSTDTYLEGFWTKGTENNATALDENFKQTYVFFPDPSAAGAQVWEVTWEGLLRGQSATGNINLSGPVSLRDGGFCGNGIVKGDIVTLNGCANDSQCPLGAVCHKDPTVDQVPGGFTVTGLCVSPHTDEGDTCTALAGTLRRYEIVSARDNELVIQPRLDEVIRSNVASCRINGSTATGAAGMGGMGGAAGLGGAGGIGGAAGMGGASGMGGAGGMGGSAGMASPTMFDDCRDPTDPTTNKFVCTSDTTAPTTRCLYPCRQDSDCRPGRACIDIPAPVKVGDDLVEAPNLRFQVFAPGQGVCADAVAINERECVPQYVTYQVNAGRSFIVSGTATGALSGGGSPDASGECQTAAPLDQRMVSRVRVDLAEDADVCPLPPPFITTMEPGPGQQLFDTPVMPTSDADAEARLRVVQAPLKPAVNNPCYFVGGPSALDTGADRDAIRHLRARFQNTQVAFVLSNFERAPVTQTTIRLDVRGGARAQTVLSPATAEISMPTRIVLGPIDARAAVAVAAEENFEAPYLFIVDQRRLGRGQGGGATRGQLLRIHPAGFEGAKGLQPIVEDFQRSGGIFPIQ